MRSLDPVDEEKSVRLRQRLWGAAVFIALLVIFLPLLLDGAGSESQYRRVERLREEPPRVLDEQGNPEPVVVIPEKSVPSLPRNDTAATIDQGLVEQGQAQSTLPIIESVPSRPVSVQAPATAQVLEAWVVQAGSFQEEINAIAVRDKLRRAGFPSFVTPTEAQTPLFRVRVGPMISLQHAERSRENVMQLLQREAIVVSYP